MNPRKGFAERETLETKIKCEINLDGDGMLQGQSSIGFFDHMLALFARHGGFGLMVEARGDKGVDFHHTVEDVGLCLGQVFLEALGEKEGIARYASLALPMDETLVLCAVDISGRPGFYYDVSFPCGKIGEFDSELVEVFWKAFAVSAKMTVHIRLLAGTNSHHIAEAVFKGMGRVLKEAARIEGKAIPSTKGVI
ncbi:MAG: imidazoleglycerol-phosphate dehydratase HisB [Peptococcaceae bacterium]|jgi:imidazoleglycerol-phosphate dehydratase|nr:imidazoleglycerol-phosphate dehydratase HisB [Peptococcaceae bacterium]MDH7525646.1 imidazoleglycerol-phosphate dehydratase HisB [Peptococcaceae bacterium]